jgi:CheY-like chemotaxis protein
MAEDALAKPSTVPRILVAHHEVAIREVLEQILRKGGCEVCTVESSPEAVSQAPHFRPDTLIIEPIMAQLDGVQAAKQIVQATNCRVLFLDSRSSSVAEREEWLNRLRQEIPNCGVLLLPFDRDEVLETIFGLGKPKKRQDEAESPEQHVRADAERPFTARCEISPVQSQIVPRDYKTDKSSYADDLIGSVVVGLGILGFLGWIALVFYAPHQKHLTTEERDGQQKARKAVANALQKQLTGSSTELDNALNDILSPITKDAGAKSQPHDDICVISLDCPPQLSKEGKYQYVQLRDGTFRRFSASTSVAEIMRAIAKDFPSCMYNPATGKLEPAPSREGETIIDLTSRKDSAASKDNLSPTSAMLRMEPRGGNNLYIYLRKSDFETVLYPDRKEFVKAVGKAWCDNTGEDSHWLLPSVYIGDIQTGEELASYSCVFDSVAW